MLQGEQGGPPVVGSGLLLTTPHSHKEPLPGRIWDTEAFKNWDISHQNVGFHLWKNQEV